MAAMPATNPPTTAVIKINKIELPPKGRMEAIFPDKTPSFFVSIHQERPAHNKNTPVNPDINDLPAFWCINIAIKKEAMAMLHQGKYKPPIKASNPVSTIAVNNFMLV